MCLLLSAIVFASVLSRHRNNFILALLSTYLKIMIWHEINEMNAVIRLHDAWGWKNHSRVSAVTRLLLQWRLLWWLVLKRLYSVCVCVCFFHAVISCVSLRAGDSEQHPEQQERLKKRKSKKEEKKTLGFQIESQVSRRDRSAIYENQSVWPFCHSSCRKEWHKPEHMLSTDNEPWQMIDRFCNAVKKAERERCG